MLIFELFRSFQPLGNPIGFGASDFLEITVAALLLLLTLVCRPFVEPYARRVAGKTRWCMLLLAVLPIVLRLALLPHHPVPAPDVYDEFGHLLVADTLRHFRLANPPHPLPQFFETFSVLQKPTYSSIYPIGQGLVLALGRLVFGLPWAGVLLSTAALCALSYWMLRAWTTPLWSLVGGLLAVIEFGPLNPWMNSYWGGSLAAAAGCLVFGALPRVMESRRSRDAALLGLGLGLHLLVRPYESVFLVLVAILFVVPKFRSLVKAAAVALAVLLPALGLTLLQNKQVTGSWTTLPYMLSRYQYGVPAAFTFQADAVPHRDLTLQQQLEYKSQLSFRSTGPETLQSFLLRLEYRVRFYRFFFLAPLYVALLFFLPALGEPRFRWVVFTLAIFALGANFYPFFEVHYLAALTCLFILVSITGLQQLSRWSPLAAQLVLFLCVAHFVFWYGLHLFEGSEVAPLMEQYETWYGINHGNPQRRILVNRQLAGITGKLLVFVRYWPQHHFQEEWVYNDADIDQARIVWARDLGDTENEKLLRYYPGRVAWLLEPDAAPPKLGRYMISTAEPAPAQTTAPPPLRFEQVK
ncbi:MAG TPA: hypothetical protein VMH80_21350 [Bryobacteraceae bacterium]|nr:hypothetical protein [Bryobacteraceae bacterium]